MEPTALDYQLKWSQHASNLNNSIAALYRNNKYADVMLLCSDHQIIPCHKLVLSSTSAYFATIFEKLPQQPMAPIVYIVLPPDLSYHAMKVLIHYMYRGESRVSNDILKEVLHAGEVLRVRGLYRTDTGKENKQEMKVIEKPLETTGIRQPPIASQTTTPLNTTSNIQNTQDSNQKLMSIINTPVPIASHNNSNISTHQKYNYDPIVFANRKIGYKILQTIDNPVASVSTNATPKPIRQQMPSQRTSIHEIGHPPIPKSSHVVNYLTIKEEPVEWTEEYEVNDMKSDKEFHIKEEDEAEVANHSEVIAAATARPQQYQKLSCEICSEAFTQPADWVRHVERHTDHAVTIPRKRRRSGLDSDEDNLASLRCDLCSTYFITPGEWVKHVQSRHTEMELAVENEKRALNPSTSEEHTTKHTEVIHKRLHKPGPGR